MVIIIYGGELIRECFFDFISNDKQIVMQKVFGADVWNKIMKDRKKEQEYPSDGGIPFNE